MEQLLNDFSPGLFVVQTILLLGLIFLMVKFAWKPILNSLNEREEGIQSALDSAEEAKKEMQNLTAGNEKLIKEARAERDALLKEAREIKDKMISEAKEEAKEEATKMIDRFEEDGITGPALEQAKKERDSYLEAAKAIRAGEYKTPEAYLRANLVE